jgi:hypothetical protein
MPPGEGHSTQLDPAQRPLVPNLHELTRLCLTLRTGLRLEDALFAKFIHLSFLELVALALMDGGERRRRSPGRSRRMRCPSA